ncbi:uncharacterized protein LOC111363389 [Spodoptera litura]|uniref:Uncharacterized protein LOC111363389 n=1 Tax=Spodoptera litura TaxID=69820 RepID=A0A9J7J3M0_SPOLT|nr:uncharacterized protein LOC111363389 [Spodoptera litura]
MEDGAGGKGNAADGEQRDIWRVGVRIPPFYPEDPELWFNQIEAQFVLSNITSDTTKFYYAVTQLEPTYVSHVKDVLRAPPATGKFEKLKNELVKRLSASKEKKLQQLFLNEDIGDRSQGRIPDLGRRKTIIASVVTRAIVSHRLTILIAGIIITLVREPRSVQSHVSLERETTGAAGSSGQRLPSSNGPSLCDRSYL